MTEVDIRKAIIDIYDVHVGLYGYDRNVFLIATIPQVAKYLNVKQYLVRYAIKDVAGHGFSNYKQEVLVKAGRGQLVGNSNIQWFEPNLETV